MPTVIDSLIVELGLDAAKFQKGTTEQKRALKELEDQDRKFAQQHKKVNEEFEAGFSKATDAFGKLKMAVGFFGVALTATGIKDFVFSTMNGVAATGRLAHSLGMSTQALQAWGLAAQASAGASADSAASSIANLSQQLEAFQQTGQVGPIIPALSRLGIATQGDGKTRDFTDILLDIANKLHGMQPREAQFWGQQAGLDQGLINFLIKGGPEVKQALDAATKRAFADDKAAEAMQKLQTSVIGLQQAMDAFSRHLVLVNATKIQRFVENLTNILALMSGDISFAEFGKRWKKLAEPSPEEQSQQDKINQIGRPSLSGIVQQEKKNARGYWDTVKGWFGYGSDKSAPPSDAPNGPAVSSADQDTRLAAYRDRMAADLNIPPDAAAGFMSNFNAESGLKGINERNPTVPGSRGGFGWPQWTGDRRVEFEKWAGEHKLDPASDEANYGYVLEELKTKYPRLLEQVRQGKMSPTDAANAVFTQYESGGSPVLEPVRGQHVAQADRIAKLPKTDPGRSNFNPEASDFSAKGGVTGALDPALLGHPQASYASNTTQNNTQMHIGAITIHTQADDAGGIAKDLHSELRQNAKIAQADPGLV